VTHNGTRQDAEPGTKEKAKSSHSPPASPEPQKIPKADTCAPLVSALDNSDCQTDTVATMPPVPSPRKHLATAN